MRYSTKEIGSNQMNLILNDKREAINQRPQYVPSAPREEFIVPLLKRNIEETLEKYGNHSGFAGAKLLDLGCGRQPFRQKLEALGYEYKGADVKQNPEGSVNYICEIDKELPLELLDTQPFNFIFCTEVMEHVADWNMAFKNFSKLLAPNGRLLITCPHFYPLHEEPYDFWRPTPYALNHFCEESGLRVISQNNAGDAWDVLGTILASCCAMPAEKSIKSRIIAKLIRIHLNFSHRIMRNNNLRSHVNMTGPIYMSNILVAEKK
jgi:SAM-dependent methyltransferase